MASRSASTLPPRPPRRPAGDGPIAPRRSTELQACRIAVGETPVAGPMQPRCPVRGGDQVGRVRIEPMLSDGGLRELERMRIVGRDGAFNDGQRFLWRPIAALG